MTSVRAPERIQTIVIGGGQAGLSVGYHLARRGLPFLILDASERIGDSWRKRWDSLRLFSPARYDGLDGMPFPAPPFSFPTKDEMADYLVVAMSDYQRRRLPPFAGELDPAIAQLHSSEYRGPAQLRPGGVLLVGAGNSAAELGRGCSRGAGR